MAQTISIVRGSTTVTTQGTVTLFTNGSSGNGTRVIINQLGFSGTNTASGNRNCGGILINNGSGVGQTVIGQALTGYGTSEFVSPFLTSSISTAIAFNTSGTVSATAQGPVSLSLGGAIQPAQSQSNQISSMMPQTFWIGPSDVIQTKVIGFYTSAGKGSSPSTVTVRYSFTLITES